MRGPWLAVLILVLGSSPLLAADPGVDEIVAVLRERGLIDAQDQARILAKSAAAQRDAGRAGLPKFLDRLRLFGDVRLRGEWFEFDRDAVDGTDEFRARYRLRLGLHKSLSDRLALGLLLASNSGAARSDNQTLGGNPDFEPDTLRIQQAFVRFDLPRTEFGLSTQLLAGRTENPYRWNQISEDAMVWDRDLNLEGGSLLWSLGEPSARVYASAGSHVIEQQSEGADSMLYGLQLGGQVQLHRALRLALRISNYQYRALTDDFLERAEGSGNLPGTFDDGHAHIGELGAAVNFTHSARWPLAGFASFARCFTAQSAQLAGAAALPLGAQSDAFLVGLELGSARQAVQLGAGVFRLEANALIAQFVDSYLFDGMTRVRGYYAFLERELRPGVQLRLRFSELDPLSDLGGAAGPLASEVRDRMRVQADVTVGF